MGMLKLCMCFGLLVISNAGFTLVAGHAGRAQCLPATTPGDEFQFTFLLSQQGDTSITQLAFYDSSLASIDVTDTVISTPATCVNNVVGANGILKITVSVDGDATLPCGIVKAGDVYTITVAVNSSPLSSYRFTCTTGVAGNLGNFPSTLNITNFATGNIENKLAYKGKKESLQFDVFHADGNKGPSKEARNGERIQLRVVQDKDYQDGRDNFGRIFHVVFLPQANSEISLNVYTRGVGTRVKVTGSLAGTAAFTNYYTVKRDAENKIVIPDAYRISSGASMALDPQVLAIKVEVDTANTDVAIRAQSINAAGKRGDYMVLPDDVLGTKYNCYTGSFGISDGHCVIYAPQASTSLTINFNAFWSAGFTIGGAPVSPTQVVSMNENDVIDIQCGALCGLITLSADKPIGVVTGHESSALNTTLTSLGMYVSQLPPVSTYGTRFILVEQLQYQIVLEDPALFVNYTRASGAVTNVASGSKVQTFSESELFIFDSPVLLIGSTFNDSKMPYTLPYPSLYQWATRHYIVVNPGQIVSCTIVAETGELPNILVRDTGAHTTVPGVTALGTQVGFVNNTVQGTPAYELYTLLVIGSNGPALVELRSGSNEKPFLLYPAHLDTTGEPGYNAMGVRYPIVNPCVQSSSITNSFGTVSRENVPGDLIDNDCNGFIDDQVNDGTNSGADLAPNPVNPNTGIYVNTLTISNNAMFPTDGTARTVPLITDGCATDLGKAFGIQPFTWNRGIGEQFTTYHVMDTQPFRAFSLGTQKTYWRAEVGFCTGNLTGSKCDNSCQTPSIGRKRRQVEETIQLETQLTITDADTGKQMEPEDVCSMNRLYWIQLRTS